MTRALALMAAFAATAGAKEPELRAVRLTNLDHRPALRLLIAPELPAGVVVREGEYVLIKVRGAAADPLALPKVEPPIEELLLERADGESIVKVKVAPEVPFEASHEPGMLTVVFGEQPAPELRGPVTPELYARLFPAPGGEGLATAPESAPVAGPTEGLAVGRLTVRPYISSTAMEQVSRLPRNSGRPADCPSTRCSVSRRATTQSPPS